MMTARRRFRGDERANAALMFALMLPMLLVGAALGVDTASLYLERRQMQGALDLAAIAAAAQPDRAFEIVRTELERNGFVPGDISDADLRSGARGMHLIVQPGRYVPDASLAPAARFSATASTPNAVHASLLRRGTLHFAQTWSSPPTIGVTSVAAAEAEAGFLLGSRLARVGGGLPAAILGGLLGSGVSLDVMSYDRLLDAEVTLLGVFEQLAQELSLGAVTYDTLFDTRVSEGALARAIARTLSGVERTAAMQIAATIGTGDDIPLRRLVNLGDWSRAPVGTDAPGLGVKLGVLDLLGAAAALSNGDHQIEIGLGALLPGIANTSVRLTVGEPPQSSGWMTVGGRGAIVRTTQLRLELDLEILGIPALLNARIMLPIKLDIAAAEARLAAMTCPTSSAPHGSMTVETLPAVAKLAIGTASDAAIRDFGKPLPIATATLINVPLLRVTGKALTELVSARSTMLTFSSAEIAARTIKTAKSSGMVKSAMATLLDSLDLDVKVLGLGLLPPGLLEGTLRGILKPLAPVLDTVVDSLLETLGISLGEADVQALGVRCTRPVLVQ